MDDAAGPATLEIPTPVVRRPSAQAVPSSCDSITMTPPVGIGTLQDEVLTNHESTFFVEV